jgi:hypothetical protein
MISVAAVWLLLSVGAVTAVPTDAQVVETHVAFTQSTGQQKASSWKMRSDLHPGSGDDSPAHLWLNGDWQAAPWAGVRFRSQSWPVTTDWLANGFVRFLINGGLDRYGSPNGQITLQVKPECDQIKKFQRLESRFVERGRGIDEDPGTWQEVLIPLRFWTELKPGMEIAGVSVQCVNQPTRSFGLAEVAYVRFDRRPAWMVEADNQLVAQSSVTWPAYKQLPETLRADRHPLQVRDGKFVDAKGRRVFVLNPYLREDNRLDLWGRVEGPPAPNHGLYDPKVHGWIYEELPEARSLCRLGFNSASITMPGPPFWDAVGYKAKSSDQQDPSQLAAMVRRVGLPFYLDAVCWPWTLGKPASDPRKTSLPPEAFTTGQNHWVPYRIVGPGRDAWLKMWQIYAARYRDAGARVLMFELFNEPAYVDYGPEHRAEFATWLKNRHGSLSALNEAWHSQFQSWDEAATVSDDKKAKKIAGQILDYDDYLSTRFTDLVRAGVKQVQTILPNTLVGVQPMGGYTLHPRESAWKHRLVEEETVVITPTGGGRWSPGGVAMRAVPTVLESPMAGAPLENDLLLALAGSKMIYDNETYLRGQTARDTRNRLWEHVVSGLDGLSIFSWSKRGWMWWKGRDAIVTEADKYPYSSLNPLARRTDALRGILDFATEIQPLADRVLPKPWGPAPRIALLHSWPQARQWNVDPTGRDKTAQYHAALRYAHWHAALLPSDRALAGEGLANLDVLIAGGIRVVEPELPAKLETFVRGGGVLVVGEEPLAEDLYGRPLDTPKRLGFHLGDWVGEQSAVVAFPKSSLVDSLTGSVTRLPNLRSVGAEGAKVILAASQDKPIAIRRKLDHGLVYVIAADLAGYPLAKVLTAVLVDAARSDGSVPAVWRAAEMRSADGSLATNVLISRRDYPTHQVLLLLNRDDYRKTVRVQVPGTGRVSEALSRTRLTSNNGWYEVTLDPGAPAVVLVEPADR